MTLWDTDNDEIWTSKCSFKNYLKPTPEGFLHISKSLAAEIIIILDSFIFDGYIFEILNVGIVANNYLLLKRNEAVASKADNEATAPVCLS